MLKVFGTALPPDVNSPWLYHIWGEYIKPRLAASQIAHIQKIDSPSRLAQRIAGHLIALANLPRRLRLGRSSSGLSYVVDCPKSQIAFSYGENSVFCALRHTSRPIDAQIAIDAQEILPDKHVHAMRLFLLKIWPHWPFFRLSDLHTIRLWTIGEALAKLDGRGLSGLHGVSLPITFKNHGRAWREGKKLYWSAACFPGHQICIASSEKVEKMQLHWFQFSQLLRFYHQYHAQ